MSIARSSAIYLIAALAAAAACGDGTDVVESACEVVVRDCGVTPSMSECLDYMGELPPDCVSCIASSDCGYPTCQREPACRLPGPLLPD